MFIITYSFLDYNMFLLYNGKKNCCHRNFHSCNSSSQFYFLFFEFSVVILRCLHVILCFLTNKEDRACCILINILCCPFRRIYKLLENITVVCICFIRNCFGTAKPLHIGLSISPRPSSSAVGAVSSGAAKCSDWNATYGTSSPDST